MKHGCHRKYNSKYNLKRHVETVHLRLNKHTCKQCQHQFASKQNLREHEYMHTGAKPFVCEVCKLCFRQASQRSLHRRVHLLKQASEAFEQSHAKPEEISSTDDFSDAQGELILNKSL
jgi:uncharacterized Zn-finger protein